MGTILSAVAWTGLAGMAAASSTAESPDKLAQATPETMYLILSGAE